MTFPKAFLFDMDGTLCNTEPLHYASLVQVLAENDQSLDAKLFETQLTGQTTPTVFNILFPELTESRRQQLIERKEALFRELAGELQPTPGVVTFLDRIGDAGPAVALVTNAPRVDMDFILDVLGMRERFKIKIVATELPHPKPHPMPYLRALEACGTPARFAVAFEDSFAGLSSATHAGVKTVGISTTLSRDALLRAGASMAIGDFFDPKVDSLLPGKDSSEPSTNAEGAPE